MASTPSTTAARARIETMRAERARVQRRRRLLLAGGAVGLVLVVVLALVVARLAGVGGGSPGSGATAGAGSSARAGLAAPAVVAAATTVPASTLDAVGVGSASLAPRTVAAPVLSVGGKPSVLYVGADYCPFCAAQRWAVVVALARFGTWSDLGATSSATNDVFPGTQTFSFHGSRYASDYLDFTGVETRTNTAVGGEYPRLDTLSAADQKVFDTYDQPPYTSGPAGSIPFLDIGGTHVQSGASFDPGLLAGKSRLAIARALKDPADPVAKAVDGSANVLTAVLCRSTGGQPGAVCTAPGVRAAEQALTKATTS